LSAKVFAGQCLLIELGFRQGGAAGFGLRRVLIDQSGAEKGELAISEHKRLQTDRVILRPGPPEEVAVVLEIYRWFVEEEGVGDDMLATAILDRLQHRAHVLNIKGRGYRLRDLEEALKG
jgi:hypothetical protein